MSIPQILQKHIACEGIRKNWKLTAIIVSGANKLSTEGLPRAVKGLMIVFLVALFYGFLREEQHLKQRISQTVPR